MNWSAHVTVAAVIERDQHFLLVEERIDGQLMLNQPAGHLEDNESLTDAVIRETREETGWHFQPTFLIGVYHWRHPQKLQTFIRFCFCGELLEQKPDANLDPEIEQSIWLTYDEICARTGQHRSPLVLDCINDYLAGHQHPLELIQNRI